MKILKAFGFFSIFASLFIITYFGYINSDNSWYAIMGREIASGNIFLNNWFGSTINHTLPYGIVEAFWSLFIHNYQLVHALSVVVLVSMFSWVVWFAVKGLNKRSPSVFIYLIIAALFAQVNTGALTSLTDLLVHAGPLMLTLSAAVLYYCYRDNKYTKYIIALLLGCWTDNYNVVYFLAPILIESFLFFVKTKKIDPMLKWVFIGIIMYVIRHILFLHVGMDVPGSDGVINLVSQFIPLSLFWKKFTDVFISYLDLWSANFWGQKIVHAIPELFFMAVMFFSLHLQYKKSKEIYNEKVFDKNRFMTFLVIGSIIIFGLALFSNMPSCGRYYVGLFINSIIILCAWLDSKYGKSQKHLAYIFVVILAMSLMSQAIQKRYEHNGLVREREHIAKIIRDEHLHNGFAWYGNSLSTNFVLNEQKVVQVYTENFVVKPMMCLLDKRLFYSDKFDFVLAWKNNVDDVEWAIYDFSDADIRKYFGNPRKVMETRRVRIYIYNDISDKVEKPKLNK